MAGMITNIYTNVVDPRLYGKSNDTTDDYRVNYYAPY